MGSLFFNNGRFIRSGFRLHFMKSIRVRFRNFRIRNIRSSLFFSNGVFTRRGFRLRFRRCPGRRPAVLAEVGVRCKRDLALPAYRRGEDPEPARVAECQTRWYGIFAIGADPVFFLLPLEQTHVTRYRVKRTRS